MKKKYVIITIVFVLIVILIYLIKTNFLYKTSNFMFYIEEKYYGKDEFNEINEKQLSSLIQNKESFVIFMHQPMCSKSYEFNKILVEFQKEEKISFYKIKFEKINKIKQLNKIKYYPSFAIINNGTLIDFLDAQSNEDINKYKNKEEFSNWFYSYITKKE